MAKNKDIESYNLIRASNEILNVLQASGRSRSIDDFPVLQKYIEDTGMTPHIKSFNPVSVNYIPLIQELKQLNATIVFASEEIDSETYEFRPEYTFYKLQAGYYLEVNIQYHSIDEYAPSMKDIIKKLSNKDRLIETASVKLMCPPPDSSLCDTSLETKFKELIKRCELLRNTTTPCVGMICQEDGEFYMKDFFIKKDYSLREADLHYGDGFTSFHEKLLGRFKDDSKGLILLHGVPGTGKTFYIRSLIKDLLDLNKYVIYLPPNMVEHMVSPEMMTFISTTVLEKAEENKSCVLLLEDAEPLLISRKTEARSNGITNLLNITDGILNDMLSLQVIATFNTELSKIDEALLRPERLIARKEFRKLRKEDAIKLADFLKLEKTPKTDMTLAELYSRRHDNEPLIHEYSDKSENKIGFRTNK